MTRRMRSRAVGPELFVNATRDSISRFEVRLGREGVDESLSRFYTSVTTPSRVPSARLLIESVIIGGSHHTLS